jgi:hypothetical protein
MAFYEVGFKQKNGGAAVFIQDEQAQTVLDVFIPQIQEVK